MAEATLKTPISKQSHDLLLDYVKSIRTRQTGLGWLNKLAAIDLIYYCGQNRTAESERIKAMLAHLGMTKEDLVEAPLVVSQLETTKAILVDTFLGGYPIFGVLADPSNRQRTEQLEALIAYYSSETGWVDALTRYFNNALKYTTAPIGLRSSYKYEFEANFSNSASKPQVAATLLPEIVVPDPYNTLFDFRVDPIKLATHGDYIGYSEMIPATAVKAEIAAMRAASDVITARLFNLDKMFTTVLPLAYWNQRPLVNANMPLSSGSRWDNWGTVPNAAQVSKLEDRYSGLHTSTLLITKLWLRILPGEFALSNYAPKTPTVFELHISNFEHIYYMAPVYLPDNRFPLGMCDLQNDNYGYSCVTEPESLSGFQYASSVLLNATLMGAERAVDDRAVFDPEWISSGNLTGKGGAAKIPLNKSLRGTTSIDQVYRQIPYEHQATASFPGLMNQVMQLANYLHGRNEQAQGLNRKGNRTLGEFNTVMQNANLRTSLTPAAIEAQAFEPLKKLLKIWIRDNAKPTTAFNHRTKAMVQIEEETIRDVAYTFKLATGYFTKNMMASTDSIVMFLQTLATMPELAQQFNVVELLSYLMTLEGVKDIDQFRVAVPPEQAPPQQPQPQPLPPTV